MHYFEWHIGDYRAATAHLTNAEDLVYRRLLDMYYDTESAISDDLQYLARRLRVDKSDLETVLSDFFVLKDKFWHHERCDSKLSEYAIKRAEDDARKENEKERQRRHRELRAELFAKLRTIGVVPAYDTPTEKLKSLLQNTPVTRDESVCHAPETAKPITNNQQPITNNQLNNIEVQVPPQKPKSDYPDWFLDIWNIYPQRAGSNDKRKAFQAANARVKSGRTITELITAVERYKFFVVSTGKLNTEYVKQASTFFGPGDHIDNLWAIPTSTGNGYARNQQTNPRGSTFGGLAHDDTKWADELFGPESPTGGGTDQPGVQIFEGDFSRVGISDQRSGDRVAGETAVDDRTDREWDQYGHSN